jgi:cell division septum initiation protein DivIVA
LEKLIDELDAVIEKGWTLPLSSGKCVVDADHIKDLVSEIRASIPAEIKQAKAIVDDRAKIVEGAKKEAEQIIHQAKEQGKVLVSQEEITRQAQQKAAEMMTQTQQRMRELRQATAEYIDAMFSGAEGAFTKAAAELRQARQNGKAQV